jgi:hypothetical protein
LLEPLELGADSLLQPGVGFRVALELIVGADPDEHGASTLVTSGRIMRGGHRAFRRREFPLDVPVMFR